VADNPLDALTVCPICAALTLDLDRHEAWHRAQESKHAFGVDISGLDSADE